MVHRIAVLKAIFPENLNLTSAAANHQGLTGFTNRAQNVPPQAASYRLFRRSARPLDRVICAMYYGAGSLEK